MRPMRQAWAAFMAGPSYATDPEDLRTVDLVGLRLPVRASLAIVTVIFALLFDHAGTFIPTDVASGSRGATAMLILGIERAILFGLVPLAIVLLVFRDRPSRYGLTLGDWRWGVALAVTGCVLMTPVVLWFATLPDARTYYAESIAPLGQLLVTNGLDLTASEFFFHGFLMLTLVRVIGPFGVLIATMPFVFAHFGKPELELFSTLGGGLVYGWVTWRTRSIVWGAIAHVYVVTLVTLAAAGF